MSFKKFIRPLAFLFISGILLASGIFLYLYFTPHRSIKDIPPDYKLTSQDLVKEYLRDYDLANEKYLDVEGESKILQLTGTVNSISTDFNEQKVILLKKEGDKAGVSCTFTPDTNQMAEGIQKGQDITVKGVIRSGARYDEDLEMYEDVILEKCSI